MLHALIRIRAKPQMMQLHLASEMFENPKSHGESKIQNPMNPSIQFSITSYILGAPKK